MESSNLELYNLTPDLLDRDALIKILNERSIDLPNMNTMNKDVLVALFHRVVAPLPQRTRCTGQPQHARLTQESRGFSIGFSGAIESPSARSKSRLKPPPDGCSAHRTVRLSTSKSQHSPHLENIIINDRRKKSMPLEAGKSKDPSISCTVSGINLLDKIVINDRTVKGKLVREDAQSCSVNTTEQTSKSNSSVTRNEGGNAVQSLNFKPRIKLKRPSLSAVSGPEYSTQLVEPQIKKPKIKIVF